MTACSCNAAVYPANLHHVTTRIHTLVRRDRFVGRGEAGRNGAVPPRASHSNHGGHQNVRVGGYGGHKQRRAFYNDLHVLETAPYVPPANDDEDEDDADTEGAGNLVWTKITAGGAVPEPRSDHSASLIALPASSSNKMMCVIGGRDHLDHQRPDRDSVERHDHDPRSLRRR